MSNQDMLGAVLDIGESLFQKGTGRCARCFLLTAAPRTTQFLRLPTPQNQERKRFGRSMNECGVWCDNGGDTTADTTITQPSLAATFLFTGDTTYGFRNFLQEKYWLVQIANCCHEFLAALLVCYRFRSGHGSRTRLTTVGRSSLAFLPSKKQQHQTASRNGCAIMQSRQSTTLLICMLRLHGDYY
jgi:hypothetical protein